MLDSTNNPGAKVTVMEETATHQTASMEDYLKAIALLSQEQPPDLLALTARQKEILGLVAQGLTNADIARQLFLTEGTVKQHLRATYKMLGVGSRVQAARLFELHER